MIAIRNIYIMKRLVKKSLDKLAGIKILSIMIVSILASSVLYGQESSRDLKNDLEFRVDTISEKIAWVPDEELSDFYASLDSTILKNGKHPLLITQKTFKEKKNTNIHCRIIYSLLLPTINAAYMDISFTSKSQNLDKVLLTFTGIDSHGNKACADTLNATSTNEWSVFKRTTHLNNAVFSRFTIEIQGNNENLEQNLWIDRITLQINGKELSDYALQDMNRNFRPDINKIVPLSFSDPRGYNLIPELKNKKIISIGESMHGSGTMAESALHIMKHRILHDNCKLLLFEMPLDTSLGINRFIQGDERFTLEDIAQCLDSYLYPESILDFFVWVKEYNKKAKKKVWVSGIDIPAMDTNNFVSATNLFSYFYRINKNIINDKIKSFLFFTLINIHGLNDELPALINDTIFYKNNNPIELNIIEHWQKGWTHIKMPNLVMAARDSLMYSNIRYMTDLICPSDETVTIYSHLMHSCYNKAYTDYHGSDLSYGSLLRKEYMDDYFCIGLFAQQGETLIVHESLSDYNWTILNFIPCTLQPVRKNSLEYLLQNTGYDYFYSPVALLPQSPIHIRLGNASTNHLYNIIYPQHCFGGILFIKTSKAMRVNHANISFMKKHGAKQEQYTKYFKLVAP